MPDQLSDLAAQRALRQLPAAAVACTVRSAPDSPDELVEVTVDSQPGYRRGPFPWVSQGSLPVVGDKAVLVAARARAWVLVQATGEQLQPPDPEPIRKVGDTGQPVFANGWTHFDASASERPAAFYRHHGRVHLEGVIKAGTIGAAAFTLPTGYLPTPASQQRGFGVVSATGPGVVYVFPNGDVTPAVGSNTWIYLDSISFRH